MKDMTIELGTSPGVNALARAKALRAEGKPEEADAVILAYEQELARKEQELSLRAYKKTRAKALSETAQIDPEHDHEVAKAVERRKVRMLPNVAGLTGIVDAAPYSAVAVQFGHLDGGPAPKGTVAPPYCLFQRQIEGAPNAVVAARAIEAKFDARMLKIHAWEARVWNRFMWDMLVARLGIEAARKMKPSIKWIPIRRFEHLEKIADDLARVTEGDVTRVAEDARDSASENDELRNGASSTAIEPDATDTSDDGATSDEQPADVAAPVDMPTTMIADTAIGAEAI